MKNSIEKVVVIGCSAGGINALKKIFKSVTIKPFFPIIVALHQMDDYDNKTYLLFKDSYRFPIKEAEDKEHIKNGVVYFAPSGYHLSLEDNGFFSLSLEDKVNFSRPSIDVLFKSAAWSFNNKVVGVLLTGSNSDGSMGVNEIEKYGGKIIIEDPNSAQIKEMPICGLKHTKEAVCLPLEDIYSYLISL